MDDRELLYTIKGIIGEKNCQDDCAVLPVSPGNIVVSTDMLHKKTDFPEGITDWQIGWMSAAVTISDIAAMGVEPLWLFMAIGLDNQGRLSEIVRGANDCAKTFGMKYVGGDIDSHDELTIVSTGIGFIKEEEKPVKRTGATPDDIVCITGECGRAMRGLSGDKKYLKNLCEPNPRVFEGIKIRKAGATAMMDTSDGLSFSLYDIAEVSNVQIIIYPKSVPAADGTTFEEVMFGGGDFELLFTISKADEKLLSVPHTCIGIVKKGTGVYYGDEILQKKGYAHHW